MMKNTVERTCDNKIVSKLKFGPNTWIEWVQTEEMEKVIASGYKLVKMTVNLNGCHFFFVNKNQGFTWQWFCSTYIFLLMLLIFSSKSSRSYQFF
jgi:hypothetical protein